MKISQFGRRFREGCGILDLMDDLGKASQQPGTVMLGGGNPSQIPAIETYFRESMVRILDSESQFESLIGRYDGPGGDAVFIEALTELFREEMGWKIGPENIALTNGSQTAFFMLFNLFAGIFPDGSRKRILLPLAPEYIGYEEVGIEPDIFVSYKPQIELLDGRLFKYRVNFEALTVGDDIGAICVSRPTNPTGNVLTDAELSQLSRLARTRQIPLVIDNAYGLPFPGIIFSDAQPFWEPHIILCLSLSKLGLPGARTGIVVAQKEVVDLLSSMNAVFSLAPGSFGASLAVEAVRRRDILQLSQQIIRPHYEQKAWQAVQWVQEACTGLDVYVHKPEGAIFLWVWFNDLPISSQTLYERLKRRGVVVVPGHHFFPGLAEPWPHRYQCIRMSYAAAPEQVHRGIQIIAEEVRTAVLTEN